MAEIKLPDLRVGRRIHFEYGGEEWLGIVMCHGTPGDRSYVVCAVPYDKLFTEDAAIPSDLFSHVLGVSGDWIKTHAETVLAVYEEPEHTSMAILPWHWGATLYTKPVRKRMTVAQICKELGYEVEIVREED